MEVHKASMAARAQKQALDVKPGAGRTRYVKGATSAIIADDKAGTGFEYDQAFVLHVAPLS